MTVADTIPLNQYTAAGGETTFDYDFEIAAAADLVVLLDGVVQTITTNYTVAGVGDESGGTITLVSPASATAGEEWTLYRDEAVSRAADYQIKGDFRAATVNADFDKIVRWGQQLERSLARALVFNEFVNLGGLDTKLPALDASKPFLRIKSDLSGIEFVGDADANIAAAAASADLAETWAKGVVGINNQTDDYTLVLTDVGKLIEMEKATAVTLTVPPNADVAFDVNTVILGVQYGAGQVTIAPGSGVTLRAANGALKTVSQYSQFSLTKRGTNEWLVAGDLET